MKTLRLSWLITLACAVAAPAFAAPQRGEPGGPGEYRDFKVLKRYSAIDGGAVFQAFVIEWEGQAVVARDAGSLMEARSDDTINVLISRGLPKPDGSLGRIVFLARPEKKPPGGFVGPASDEAPVLAQLKVSKVYELQSTEYSFRAYEVSWKGSDVIVFDAAPTPTYAVGDTIPVRVGRHLHEYGGETKQGMSFLLDPHSSTSRATRSRSR